MFNLLLLDIDRTIVDFNDVSLYPAMVDRINEMQAENARAGEPLQIALVSNQGGPACHDAGWNGNYPEYNGVLTRIQMIKENLEAAVGRTIKVYTCYAFEDKGGTIYLPKALEGMRNSVNWNYMRKPGPGMLAAAMADAGVGFQNTLMVGDSQDDQGAAKAARCTFMWAEDFLHKPFEFAVVYVEDETGTQMPDWKATAKNRVEAQIDALGEFEDILFGPKWNGSDDHFYWVATAHISEIRVWAIAERIQAEFNKGEGVVF